MKNGAHPFPRTMNLAPFVLALSSWSAPSPNGFSEAMRLGAFRALDDLGLVEIDQNREAFKIDLDEAIEIHDVYSALEELAARSAARRLSGTQIAELRVPAGIDGSSGGSRRPRSISLSQCRFSPTLNGEERQPETLESL